MRTPARTRPRTTYLALTSAVALALFVAACSSDGASGSEDAPTTSSSATADTGSPMMLGAWALTAYTSGGAQYPAADPPATIELDGEGTYTGSTGCNTTSGTWTGDVDGPTTFELGPTTLAACNDPEVEAQESALLEGLPEVTDSRLDGDTLALVDADGADLFTFERIDGPSDG